MVCCLPDSLDQQVQFLDGGTAERLLEGFYEELIEVWTRVCV